MLEENKAVGKSDLVELLVIDRVKIKLILDKSCCQANHPQSSELKHQEQILYSYRFKAQLRPG